MPTELCVNCRQPTTNRGRISGKPLCRACSSKPLKETTLAKLARPGGRGPKPAQCRICLADEVLTPWGNQYRSSLRNGVCKDRTACEERQPPLIPVDELGGNL